MKYYVKFTLGAWHVFSPEGESVAVCRSDSHFDGSILAQHLCSWMNSHQVTRSNPQRGLASGDPADLSGEFDANH